MMIGMNCETKYVDKSRFHRRNITVTRKTDLLKLSSKPSDNLGEAEMGRHKDDWTKE
jgi:hypothetical protein